MMPYRRARSQSSAERPRRQEFFRRRRDNSGNRALAPLVPVRCDGSVVELEHVVNVSDTSAHDAQAKLRKSRSLDFPNRNSNVSCTVRLCQTCVRHDEKSVPKLSLWPEKLSASAGCRRKGVTRDQFIASSH